MFMAKLLVSLQKVLKLHKREKVLLVLASNQSSSKILNVPVWHSTKCYIKILAKVLATKIW